MKETGRFLAGPSPDCVISAPRIGLKPRRPRTRSDRSRQETGRGARPFPDGRWAMGQADDARPARGERPARALIRSGIVIGRRHGRQCVPAGRRSGRYAAVWMAAEGGLQRRGAPFWDDDESVSQATAAPAAPALSRTNVDPLSGVFENRSLSSQSPPREVGRPRRGGGSVDD